MLHNYQSPLISVLKTAFALLAMTICLGCGAQSLVQNPADRSPVDLRPEEDRPAVAGLGVGFLYDSNTYDTNLGGNNSWISILAPTILLKSPPSSKRYALVYSGEYGHFFADSADDYDDHVLVGAAKYQFGSRGQLDLAAAFEQGHRDRGSGQTDGLDPTSPLFPTEPDIFHQRILSGKFHYGAEGNRGRLNFGFGASDFSFTNNPSRTQFLEFDTKFASGGMSLLLRQKTSLVFDAVFTDIRYGNAQPVGARRDSTDWRYLLGVTWLATTKTEGSVRFGIQQRRFTDADVPKSSNPSWAVDVRWSPREFSYVDLITSRANEETDREGAFIDRKLYKVAWTHTWGAGWQSVTSWERRDSDFVDSARVDEWEELYIGLRFPQGRLLIWDIGYAWRSRDSTLERLVFDGNLFSIGVNIGT